MSRTDTKGGHLLPGKRTPAASMRRGGSSWPSSGNTGCTVGVGASGPPFRALVSTEDRKAGYPRKDLPTVMAQTLGTGGISPGPPARQPSPGAHEPQCLVTGGGSLSGLCACRGAGLGVGKGSEPRASASPGSFLPLPFLGGTRRQQPRPPAWDPQGKGGRGLCSLGSCSQEGWPHPRGATGPAPPTAGRRPAEGCPPGGGPGLGLGQKTEKGNRPLALFSASSLTKDDPPPPGPLGLARSSHQDRDVDVHTHSHAHCTHTHTHPSSHSALVLKTQACVNSVRNLHSRNEAGSLLPGLDH